MTNDWIARLADDERKRDALRSLELEVAARKAELVRRHGPGLLHDLHATMTQDVDVFRHEFPDDQARDIIVDNEQEGGFAVRKPGHPAVSLSVAPRWAAAAVGCRYCFTSDNGMPAREDRFELVLAPQGDDAAQFKHHSSGQVFGTVEALSEYLLTPVFTGRPR
jgi:hypothetical protein